MKTILFLENGVYGGGSFESLFLLITHLDKTRFRPVVVFVNKTVFYDRLRAQGIPVYVIHDSVYSQKAKPWIARGLALLIFFKRLFPIFTLAVERLLHRGAIRALRDLIKTHKVDLVHLNNQSMRDLYGVIVAAKMKIPCVSHLRSARASRVPDTVAHFLNEHVSWFVANSQFAKAYWQSLGIDHSKIKVVYNAIDDASLKALDVRTQWGIDPSVKYVIGCVGNLADGKGQEFLIRSFQKVLGQEPHTALLIVGGGSRKLQLEQLAEVLKIKDKIVFVGYDSRAKEIIAGLDLLVLPSQTETFGRALLEAMIVGTPVVATRVGGIPEIVEHKLNGLLVEYGDEEGLANVMAKMLTDQTLQSRCVEAGKNTAQRFTIRPHIEQIQNTYDQILGTNRTNNPSQVHSG